MNLNRIYHRLYMRRYRRTDIYKKYRKKYMKQYYKRRYAKDKKNERQRAYRKFHGYPTNAAINGLRSRLKHCYRISLETYEGLYGMQNGACAICKTPERMLDRRLSVDHCHRTMSVRGLLCRKCNSAIGYLRDDHKLVANALKYLKRGEWK